MGFFQKIFGDPNEKEVSKYQKIVDDVNALESGLEKKTDAELRKQSLELRDKIRTAVTTVIAETEPIPDRVEQNTTRKKIINKILEPELAYAFALVREASKRTLGLRHYDVQIIGGVVLHQGQIAEMQTGEGKTLVATLPLYLNALTGLGVHLVTVNDYLARRDAGWMSQIYDFLGLTVGVIGPQFSFIYDSSFDNGENDWRLQRLRPVERREAYAADITYGTNNEYGFDYLRDNMLQDANQLVQRELAYAIVDEVDSILIDEARTPLIISAPSSESAGYYKEFAKHVKTLKPQTDFIVDEKAKSAALTNEGIQKLEKAAGVSNLYDPSNAQLVHYADTSLKAYALFKKNKDYVVKDGQIVIVDEFTGRLLHGRRYSSGLHQAIEAKEGVIVQEESVTLATITFQNYFRLYFKLAGMTGTASTEAEEFSKIYHLEVVSIPTNRPSQRRDLADVVYKTERAKFKAVAELVRELQQNGQPVLIGTVSIAKSETISKLLKSEKIEHRVLNAKFHQKEGEIVAEAGLPGSVTVATNMAGRGVDIVLGGPPPSSDAPKQEFTIWEKRHQEILERGGLYVIGTERHESRRIDNQLRGRAGRQGDPGVSQFFVSMEDDLMRIFGGDRMKAIMERLNIPEDLSINNKLLSRAIEQAQSKVETHNFDIRKQLVEYDDVMNKHREAIYRRRERIVRSTFSDEAAIEFHDEIVQLFTEEQQKSYEARSKDWGTQLRFEVERAVVLRAIDVLWVEHLKNLEDLRESIGLQAYGQREPLVEYKQQAYRIFSELQDTINRQIVEMLLHVNVGSAPPEQQTNQRVAYNKQEEVTQPQSQTNKIGRNDPCPCGAIDPVTGKVYKYKKCGLINAPHHRQ